jgi:Fur family transcriptional regulator, ferric uptake regulator
MAPNPPLPPRAPSFEANRFETYLRSKKLKLTGERMEILATIFRKDKHFDAEELHGELKAMGRDISRATVYRTLDLLVQCGLVRKSSLGSSHANYEAAHENEHHDHLICLSCNKVIEFYRPDLETLQDAICGEKGFKPLHHSLQIFGLCSECVGKADENAIRSKVAQIHT